MEVVGKIKVKQDVQTFDSGFQKQTLVVTTDDQYPQHIAIEFLKDNIDLIKSFKVNDSVKVSINLGGREWINPKGEAKYFNSVTGWKVESAGTSEPTETKSIAQAETNDLPF